MIYYLEKSSLIKLCQTNSLPKQEKIRRTWLLLKLFYLQIKALKNKTQTKGDKMINIFGHLVKGIFKNKCQ